MNNSSKVSISSFLSERDGRYKPNDTKIKKLKRLDKIDFSGNIHISEKPTKTDMIIVQPGDLVISGINVAKGAISIYEGNEPVAATIHYSSYIFDKKKIDISYFKRYLKSPLFIQELQNQVKGGIKTEIKPKHLLPIIIDLPDITEQQKINSHFKSFENELSELDSETLKQQEYLSLIRQSILQEAIEGKLTDSWRKKNPVRKGDLEYDAHTLLEKIKEEKGRMIAEGKIKKQKPIAPIKPEEVPFALPEGWVWTRLGEICSHLSDIDHNMPKAVNNGVKFISAKDLLNNGTINFENNIKYISELDFQRLSRKIIPQKNDIIYSRIGACLGKARIVKTDERFLVSYSCCTIRTLNPYIEFINWLLESNTTLNQATFHTTKNSIPDLGIEKIKSFIIGFPPLAEQRVIVERVDSLLAMVDEVEKQASERKVQAEELMQSVLREAFGGR